MKTITAKPAKPVEAAVPVAVDAAPPVAAQTIADWAPPFPATGLVRAFVRQEVRINGRLFPAGHHSVLNAELAHTICAALDAPKDK